MTSRLAHPTDERKNGPDLQEPVGGPGVDVSWALHTLEVTSLDDPPVDADTATLRHAATLLDVERAIADRVRREGDAVTHIRHTLGGRDVHLRDGSRIEFRWHMVISDWRCADCGVNTDAINEYYMVLDPLWEHATNGLKDIHLCIECLEHRLGRTLTAADFTKADINTRSDTARSPRLQTRLANTTDPPAAPA